MAGAARRGPLRPARRRARALSTDVARATVRDEGVAELVGLLTAELASSGYADDEMFGYSLDDLDRGDVQLVVARRDGLAVALGGVELDGDIGELKRFYVRREHRGAGVADAVLAAVLDVARTAGVTRVRLETGTEQRAAMAFYRRNGFRDIPRFGPYVDSASSVCMERTL